MSSTEQVVHMRWVEDLTVPGLRVGDPEASITDGPVSLAATEIVRDITERCGHKVTPVSSLRTLDGYLRRYEFMVDVNLDDGSKTMQWHHVVAHLADSYRRMEETS